ncbi:MAG: hypothetical protein E7671_04160 [Ruminococcaceae bacterium]|nr:hypothetical protein [Oscillospiraceae bacterium]
MSDFISRRRRRRLIPLFALMLAAILAVGLYFLLSDYNAKEIERRNELFLLNIQMYEEMQNSGTNNTGNVDRVLAEKLKNYNFYEKLTERLQVNALFLGNEVIKGGNIGDPNLSWINRLAREIEEDGYCADLKGANFGLADSDPFYGYNMLNFYSLGLDYYDFVIVCYGADEDPETFELYYDALLRSIKNQNKKCEIYCIIEADVNGYGPNAETVRAVCANYGGVCVDMNEYFRKNNISFDSALDGYLPNEIGNSAYYDCVSGLIQENIANGRKIPEENKPYLSTSRDFDDYKAVERAEMKRVGDSVLEFYSSGKVATLITKNVASGGTVKVYVNGKKMLTTSNKISDTVQLPQQFTVIADDLSGVNKIRIETSEENLTNIIGVAFSGEN